MSRHKYKRLKHQITSVPSRWYFCLSLAITILLGWVGVAAAQDSNTNNFTNLSTIWLLVSSFLVFFMNAGFAMLEAGLCRRRNATNVLAKNLIVFCISALAFWLVGFGLMFGDGITYSCVPGENASLSLVGQKGLFFNLPFPQFGNLGFPESGFNCLNKDWSNHSFAALFLFQLVFAGTAATIVSGAVAERVKFWAFLLFSFFLVGFIYPLTGHWVWGHYGWLAKALKFHDFAGSTVVHSVGGMAGLVGAWLLKPRQGRFGYNLRTDRYEGLETEKFSSDNLGLATLGCLILWLGWFGFNGGSAKDLDYVANTITTTMMAAAAGGISSVFFSPIILGKPSLASIINGILGGLVGITASAAFVDIRSAFIIGSISGIFVLLGEYFLQVWKIDDPVGSVPVHLFCGFWGTIALGIFSSNSSLLYSQLDVYDDPLLQVLCQFLGWLIIIIVTALLSLVGWLLVSLILYYASQINERISGKQRHSQQFRQTQYFQLGEFILTIFEIARRGIRVSLEEEISGSDGVFYNP